MKKTMLILVLVLVAFQTWACPACEKQQPRLLRGITHGTGPENSWDYVITGVTAIIVLLTLCYTIKWICRPAEQSANHIKRFILNED